MISHKNKFRELLEEVTLSMNCDPQSDFFALFFGKEWDTLITMLIDLADQREKAKEKMLATLQFSSQRGAKITENRGDKKMVHKVGRHLEEEAIYIGI